MKTIFFILVMVFMVGTASAVQPARKPFVKIKIDGTAVKTGDILTVTHGRKLKLEADLEGGRRDYCKFPDSYADIAGTAQILSRGENGITYILNDKKYEWKLASETYKFSGDENIVINSSENQPTAEIIISDKKFSQSFIKAEVKATWQFSEGGITLKEENVAEASIYFKIAGSSDLWFQSQNIKANGIQNNAIQDKLVAVQSACDSIEKNLSLLKIPVAQQNIRNMQASVGELKTAIDEVKAGSPNYQLKITFSGLPSDKPLEQIARLSAIKNSWTSLEPFLNEQKQALEKLPQQPSADDKKELASKITQYSDWQTNLPENALGMLNQYISGIHTDSISVPEKIRLFSKMSNEADYAQILNEYKTFIDRRIKNYPGELQNINTINNRIQAVRLFDGMLRSYFNSISWAEWINTRE